MGGLKMDEDSHAEEKGTARVYAAVMSHIWPDGRVSVGWFNEVQIVKLRASKRLNLKSKESKIWH